MASVTPLKLPVVHHNITGGRCYFGGPYTRTDNVLSPQLLTESSPLRRLDSRIRISTMLDAQRSASVTKHFESRVDTMPAPPSRESYSPNLIPMLPRKLVQTRVHCKSSSDIMIKGKRKIQRSPDIESYLDYLGNSSNNNVNSFAYRLREKSTENNFPSKEESVEIEKPDILEGLTPIAIPIEVKLFLPIKSIPGSTSGRSSVKSKTPKSKRNSSEASTISGQSIRTPKSKPQPVVFKDTERARNRKFAALVGDKDQEVLAKELSEELVANYRAYVARAAKNSELNAKISTVLVQEGLEPIFQGKVGRHLPLNVRIYNDMIEYFSEDQSISKFKKKDPAVLQPPKTLKRQASIPKKSVSKLRLIPAKYLSYVNVNKEIITVNTAFKVQGVYSLEGKLFQAHEDFVKAKKQVLRNVMRLNIKKYRELKTQCQHVQNMVSPLEVIDMNDDKKVEGTVSETITINNGLKDVMKRWEKNLANNEWNKE